MKRTVFVVALFTLAIACYAEDKSFFSLEGAYYPKSAIVLYGKNVGPDVVHGGDAIAASLAFKISFFGFLYLNGDATTIMVMQSATQFYPFLAQYQVGAGIELDRITIGAQHLCAHPVNPFGNDAFAFDRGYDKLYVQYKITF